MISKTLTAAILLVSGVTRRWGVSAFTPSIRKSSIVRSVNSPMGMAAIDDWSLARPRQFPTPYNMMRIFEDLTNSVMQNPIAAAPYVPLDIKEAEKTYEIMADVPGTTNNDIKVDVHDHVLNITYKRESAKREDSETLHRMERVVGIMERSLVLPTDASEEHIKAECANGVLHITIPKMGEKETRKHAKHIKVHGPSGEKHV